jgi:hypothetical protein
MCIRNYHGGIINPNLKLTDISIDEFKNIITCKVLQQIRNIYFCGNYGDPIMSNHLISIVQYCVEINPSIEISIHTNGSARSKEWWELLAHSLPKFHKVHFALDGLRDTHHLYRIGTHFETIIENAKAFIKAGGLAEWTFLSFDHNQHQIEEARQMAKHLGFSNFSHKATSRFVATPWFDVLDKTGNVVYKIKPATEHVLNYIAPEVIKSYRNHFDNAEIKCRIQTDKSLYIDANKMLWPCCWIGAIPYSYSRSTDLVYQYQQDQSMALTKLINDIGGYATIDLHNHSIEDILNNPIWQNIWQEYWAKKEPGTCIRTCGIFPKKILSNFDEQWINTESL